MYIISKRNPFRMKRIRKDQDGSTEISCFSSKARKCKSLELYLPYHAHEQRAGQRVDVSRALINTLMETCRRSLRSGRLRKAKDGGYNRPSDTRMRSTKAEHYPTISTYDHQRKLQQTCNAPPHSCIVNRTYGPARHAYHFQGQAQCRYHKATLSAIHHYLESAARVKAKKTLRTHTLEVGTTA